ncbi:hypothetical protein MnTg03_00178 [bacterium MnTg03]|nr:hypothetical protein MnTg03_00178 [bacterium MnTg03]
MLSVFDTTSLGQTQVTTFTDRFCAYLFAIDPDFIIIFVGYRGIGFCSRLDIGSDTAIPDQIYPRFQQII